MKTKPNRADYMFKNRKGEILIKNPGQINGLDFVVMYCEDCTIYICDITAQVFLDASKNCKVYFGPTTGSLFIRQCEDVEVSCAAGQFRVSNSKNIKCNVYAQSDPALEKSSNIILGPYNFSYPQIQEHFERAQLNLPEDKWSQVFDFTPNFNQRNWSIQLPEDYQLVSKEIDEFGEVQQHPVPIPVAYGGSSTKQVIIGSLDAANQEQGGQGLDFIMGKDRVDKIQAQQFVESEQSDLISQKAVYAQSHSDSVRNFEQFDALDSTSPPQTNNPVYTNTASKTYQDIDSFEQPKLNEQQKVVREKEVQEMKDKQERRLKAQQFLQQFNNELLQKVTLKKQQNRIIQNGQTKQEINKNPWQTILQNIKIKDYQGDKEISSMQRALLARAQQ